MLPKFSRGFTFNVRVPRKHRGCGILLAADLGTPLYLLHRGNGIAVPSAWSTHNGELQLKIMIKNNFMNRLFSSSSRMRTIKQIACGWVSWQDINICGLMSAAISSSEICVCALHRWDLLIFTHLASFFMLILFIHHDTIQKYCLIMLSPWLNGFDVGQNIA